ncbi:MAG TPA: 3'-5' exonuclease domain-containing protein 2 [Candidatus Marinimicrobia bacterium]|jgi:ribonuclease D|nr:3'-5' exonuclease domain-containing protein 2 [Candidatus Neomarinimicrobiota bacterium]
MALDKNKLSKTEINSLPLRYYNGAIRIIQTAEQAKDACAILIKEKVLGFDTETRPAFKKGQSYLPSLLQLAGTKVVYLFQLSQCGLTDSIIILLSNVNIIKSGVAINQDLTELQQILNFEPAGFVDLGDIARSKGLPHHGLRGLAAYLLKFRISKSGRTSNWSANQLTKKQIKYAATDAWVGRELYLKYKQIKVI